METSAIPSPAAQPKRSASLISHAAVVTYGDNRVLNGVSVDLVPGKVTGIVGPNGSGKTTLLKALAGLVKLESGAIRLDGQLITDVPSKARARRVAYMPQLAGEHSFMALELVLTGRYPHLGWFQLEGRSDTELARESMRRTGTLEFANRRMQTLSGGERQRISLARTLAQTADVLLLDEPTASMDMQHQLLTMAIAREEANAGAAVAVVMHDLSLAAQHCDVLHMMNKGKVVASGKPWDVVTQANMREVFSVNAAVEPESIFGRPSVSLIGMAGQASKEPKRKSARVHIICGAGSGRDLMHRLSLAGHSITSCVLGIGDADGETAVRLGIPHVSSEPFSVITLEQDALHRRMVREADAVVVCEMAIGPGNLRNLEAAAEAKRLLLIERPEGAEWDYTDGAATKVYSELLERSKTVSRDGIQTAIEQVT